MKSILRRVSEESDIVTGDDLSYLLRFASQTTIKIYVRKGWLRRDNGKLILTEKGFKEGA